MMKTLPNRGWTILAVAVLGMSSGCYQVQPLPDPLPAARVVDMSGEGRSPEEIIGEIRKSRTVYFLRSGEVKALLEQGVDERVVDYMLETRIRDLERRHRYDYYPYWYPYYPYWHVGFGYHYHW